MNCCQLKKSSYESRQWAIKLGLNTLANHLSALGNWKLSKRLVSKTTDICSRDTINKILTPVEFIT